MTGEDWPPLPHLSTGEDAAYEWLLSAHPWAVAERARRRQEHHARELAEAADVLAITDRLGSTPEAGETLHHLADTVAPLARRSALAVDVNDAEPDDTRTAEARRHLENARRAAGDFDYRYPPELADPATAADYPPPPDPEARP